MIPILFSFLCYDIYIYRSGVDLFFCRICIAIHVDIEVVSASLFLLCVTTAIEVVAVSLFFTSRYHSYRGGGSQFIFYFALPQL